MSKIAKATFSLMIITMLSKVLGFARELVLGATYGASGYSDIYIIAMNIPSVLFSTIGAALATTFIPLYYENYNLGGDTRALKYTNNMFNIAIILGVILSIVAFIFAKQLTKVFAIGFDGEKLNIAIKFTRIMIFCGLIIIANNIITSLLQIKEKFIITGFVGLPYNIIIIISIVLSIKINIYILPVGTLVAMISQFLIQYVIVYKNGYRYKYILNIKDEYVRRVIWLVGPVFIGVAVNQINTMVDRTLASTLIEGSISALNYANRLNGFVMGIFITTLGAVIYPMLSKLSSEKDKDKFTQSMYKSINTVILLLMPITIGAIVLSKPIVKLLFERGAFNTSATDMTSSALVFYSLGMVSFGLRDILGKVFYSLQDTKTPMLNGAIAMSFNIILNLLLVKIMGHRGLALATSISATISIIFLFVSLRKKIGYFGEDKIIITLVKSLIASMIMGIIILLTYRNIILFLGTGFINEAISLSVCILLGSSIYGIIIILLKIEEVDIIVSILNGKIKNNKKQGEIA